MFDLQQRAELKKTWAECERRLEEAQEAVQDRMWTQYVEAEIRIKFLEAEVACDRAHESMCPEQLQQVTELIQEASASLVLRGMDPARTDGEPSKQSGDPDISSTN